MTAAPGSGSALGPEPRGPGHADPIAEPVAGAPSTAGQRFLRRLLAQRFVVAMFVLLVLFTIVALAAPWVSPYDPNVPEITKRLAGPSAEHWLGNDELGRDMLSRLIHGTRISLYAAVQAVALAFAVGVPIGLLSGIVGESGSGKSVTAMSILRLLPTPPARFTGGRILLDGVDLLRASEPALNRIRGNEIAMIFQEPLTSLNPAFTVGEQVAEVVRRHRNVSRREAWARAVEMLDKVGIPSAARRADDYPHSFSGGMRQRAMIAAALACDPKLLIADEPTTALDVTVQALVLDLLSELRAELDMALILITHDLGVIADVCERALVMYAGQTVEESPIVPLFDAPSHPYTEGLLRSIPTIGAKKGALWSIPGVVPPPWAMPGGCRFHPRCDYAAAPGCTTHPIPLTGDGVRRTRCARSGELALQGGEA